MMPRARCCVNGRELDGSVNVPRLPGGGEARD
jgi:hypothetical protein